MGDGMRCTKCGKELAEGAAFCGQCGAQVDAVGKYVDFSSSVGVPSSGAMPSASQQPIAYEQGNREAWGELGVSRPAGAGGRGKVVAIVAVVLVAGCAIAVALGVFAKPQAQLVTSSAAVVSQLSSVSESSSAAGEADAGDGSRQGGPEGGSSRDAPAAADSSSAESAVSSSSIVDLNDPAQLAAVNLFLSNFTEKGALMNGYTYEGTSDVTCADYAMAHINLNAPEDIHPGMGEGAYEVEVGTFCHYASVFLKRNLVPSFYGGAIVGPYSVFEGAVNVRFDRIPAIPQGVAYATGARDIGDGCVEVTFDVYWDGTAYTATEEAYYTGDLAYLQARFGRSPSATGTAVIEPYADGSLAPFLLWSYDSTC